MKTLAHTLIVIAFSVLIWLHWGGFSNGVGTIILGLADAFIISIILDNRKKSPAKD